MGTFVTNISILSTVLVLQDESVLRNKQPAEGGEGLCGYLGRSRLADPSMAVIHFKPPVSGFSAVHFRGDSVTLLLLHCFYPLV